jgi:hypothetical protein
MIRTAVTYASGDAGDGRLGELSTPVNWQVNGYVNVDSDDPDEPRTAAAMVCGGEGADRRGEPAAWATVTGVAHRHARPGGGSIEIELGSGVRCGSDAAVAS